MTVPDGFVPTPPAVADYMAATLFCQPPSEGDRILFPGAGTGCLAAAVKRYCAVRDHPCPDGVAVETDADRLAVIEEHVASDEPAVPPLSTRSKHRLRPTYPTVTPSADRSVTLHVETHAADFLLDPPAGEFDYIIANPPFTRYRALDADARDQYREAFRSATGRFGLHMPFVEQMQRLLAPDGWLVFLAPASYLVAENAAAFRDELRRDSLHEFMLLPGATFPDCKVDPVVTALSADPSLGRDGHFWLESFMSAGRVDDLLRDLGIQSAADREDLVDEYYTTHKTIQRLLESTRLRMGADGGYNMDRIPSEHRPGDSHQADLGQWS